MLWEPEEHINLNTNVLVVMAEFQNGNKEDIGRLLYERSSDYT